MKCYKCGINNVPLFRQNPKGEEGIWACEPCGTARIDPEVKEIVDIIAGNGESDG